MHLLHLQKKINKYYRSKKIRWQLDLVNSATVAVSVKSLDLKNKK
jgi:hypothetical protein